jgi:hypothetical protein
MQHVDVHIDPRGKRTYTAREEVWLTEDDRAVEAGDPAAKTLLVAAGATISGRDAARYGLLPDAEAALYPDDEQRAVRTAEIIADEERKAAEAAKAADTAAEQPADAETPTVEEGA